MAGINVDLDANPHDHNLNLAFQEKRQTALCPCRPHYLCTAPFANCKFWSPQPQMLCKKSYPIQSKTAFPNKKQALLLDNNEKRNSSLGNVILKSDFPTNHTQLVSNAMFLSDYGIPADFSAVSILWFPPSSQQKKASKTPSQSYMGWR